MAWTPRLRTVLLIVNVAVMALPLGSVVFLRLYEQEMIRQKEASLHAQGAYLTALFRRELLDSYGVSRADQESPRNLEKHGLPISPLWRHPLSLDMARAPTAQHQKLDAASIRDPHARRFYSSTDIDPDALRAGEALLPMLLRAQTRSLDRVRLVDHRGDVVASSPGEEGRRLIMWEEVQRALFGEDVSLLRRTQALRRTRSPLDALGLGAPMTVEVAMPVVAGGRILGAVVLTGMPSQITEFIYGNQGQLLTALAVLMLAVSLISIFSSLTISEPVQAVIRQTQLVAAGDPAGTTPIRFPVTREIKLLTQAIARMAAVIDERAGYITAFARSVSHEFKTPLTGITGTTELLLDHGETMGDADKRRFLENLNRDALRLSALVRRLLDYARADVAARSGETSSIDAAVAAAVARARGEGLVATQDGFPLNAKVPLPEDLLEAVLTNLLDNVRLHGPAGVRATVAGRLTVGEFGVREVEIVVTDDGPGISVANQAKVFEPFFTTARLTGGTGLGLAIVATLVRGCGGSARLDSELGKGTIVTVRLPII